MGWDNNPCIAVRNDKGNHMKNIDQDEVAKFNRNENDWWDLQGDFSPLHAINPLRVGFINQRSLLKNKRVLDVGCGGGILSEAMSKYGANVVGIDAADKAIRAAVLVYNGYG